MIKEYKQDDYIKIVKSNIEFFKSYYFHSIVDQNLIKLDYILKNGILSKELIERKGLIRIYSDNADSINSKNGQNFVSITDMCDDFYNGTIHFDTFLLHTLNSLSFMIDKKIKIYNEGERKTHFCDEKFVLDKIDLENIKGIILPENLSNKYIINIPFLHNEIHSHTEQEIIILINSIEEYFNTKINKTKILSLVYDFNKRIKKYNNRKEFLSTILKEQKVEYGEDIRDTIAIIINELFSEKLNINNPKFIDVVKYINNKQMPIYEINKTEVKKLILK